MYMCTLMIAPHSTYDWTINETDKTNVARDDDVVLRQKATCKHLIGTRHDRRGKRRAFMTSSQVATLCNRRDKDDVIKWR